MKLTVPKAQITPLFLERWYPLLASILAGYCIADLSILYLRPMMLPTKAPPSKLAAPIADASPPRGGFNTITSKNIFSWDGTIPDPLTPKGEKAHPGAEQVPVLSQLPLNLIGTIVHSKAEKSVASIEVKSKNMSVSIRVKGEIENMAEILKIERNRVTFRNLNNNQLEFIEIQNKNKISFQGSNAVTKAPSGDDEVKVVGANQFTLKRSDVLKHTSNLASLLQQARSAPHRNPQTGEIDGFTILDYQPGSIFEKLGIQRMDVLKAVNGEAVDSPAKAMELYNALKNSDKVSISVDRGGKSELLDYSITK